MAFKHYHTIILPGQFPQRGAEFRKTQYIVFIGLRHFDDEMKKSHPGFVGSGVQQFG